MSDPMTAPTWYDLLDVDRTATTDEIRSAWKEAVAGLDPTDRRFRSLSDAAAVLLDDDKRAAYDATLAPEPDEVGPGSEEDLSAALIDINQGSDDDPAQDDGAALIDINQGQDRPSPETGPATVPARRPPLVGGWVLATLGVAAAACVAAAVVSYTKAPDHRDGGIVTVANDNTSVATTGSGAGKPLTYNHTLTVESDGAAALAAAKTAIVPILSYDYRDMAKSKTEAEAYMTPAYRAEYEPLFAVLAQNAPNTKTIVTTNPPIDAGVERVSPGEVQVLLFVDRPTTNARTKKPQTSEDQVTVTMVDTDGTWLVNEVQTAPVQP